MRNAPQLIRAEAIVLLLCSQTLEDRIRLDIREDARVRHPDKRLAPDDRVVDDRRVDAERAMPLDRAAVR